jgi:PleD family two-component response regulator
MPGVRAERQEFNHKAGAGVYQMARILILDDVSDLVNLVKRILTEAGHEVFPFTEEEIDSTYNF